jgi:membrane-associated phospholipid phosphatase
VVRPPAKALAITGTAATAVLLLTSLVASNEHLPAWDGDLAEAINDAPRGAALALGPVMQLGALLGALVVAIVAAYFWGVRRGAMVMTSALLAWLGARLLKDLIERGRPAEYVHGIDVRGPTPHDFGFPSGHAAVAFAVATALLPVLPRWGRVGAYAVATLVAVARVVHGVHFPLDTIGGACVGVISGCVVELFMRVRAPRPE